MWLHSNFSKMPKDYVKARKISRSRLKVERVHMMKPHPKLKLALVRADNRFMVAVTNPSFCPSFEGNRQTLCFGKPWPHISGLENMGDNLMRPDSQDCNPPSPKKSTRIKHFSGKIGSLYLTTVRLWGWTCWVMHCYICLPFPTSHSSSEERERAGVTLVATLFGHALLRHLQ